MILLVLLLQLPSPPILTFLRSLRWLKVQERIEYKVIFTTYKLQQSSSPRYLRDLITVQSSRSTRLQWLLFSSHQFTPVSKSLTALFRHAVYHLWNELPLLFVLLTSLMHHNHPCSSSSHHAVIFLDPYKIIVRLSTNFNTSVFNYIHRFIGFYTSCKTLRLWVFNKVRFFFLVLISFIF